MSITDELRKYATVNWNPWPAARDRLFQMCDHIDAEHERQLEVLYRDMSDAEYVKLPKDADGVPIRVGDKLRFDNGMIVEVRYLKIDSEGTSVCVLDTNDDVDFYAITDKAHHYRKPTVDDLLFSYGQACIRINNEAETEAARQTMLANLRNEYDAKLRLADDGEE